MSGNVVDRGTKVETRLHEYPVDGRGRPYHGPCVYCGWRIGEPFRNCTDRGDLSAGGNEERPAAGNDQA